MSDIAARLRQTHRMGCECVGCEAADEIERLRRELGQVSDADSWVSKMDAALLDSLLNWCEFNAMDSYRALQRLVNDRARLRAEVIRLRAGGCARDQTTTQFCAEAERLRNELAARCGIGGAGAHTAGPTETFIPEAL